ncbi:MAG TPA: hypothetical protein VHS78_00295 [Candidatus Elarobacter sp.]|jgi:hypothetical protein|nr:hypothetical protein [Candidatus Elarobacter sp.]
MTELVLRHEWSIARAAVRRVLLQPSRRTLWALVVALAMIAVALEVATSGSASRNLGSWSPIPLQIVAVACGAVAIAALAGRRTTLTYGTRAADAAWWRYAGVDTGAGHAATTAVLAVRTAFVVTAVAAPVAALFAIADVSHAAPVLEMAVAAIVIAPLVVLASSATASRSGEAFAAAEVHRTAAAEPPRERVQRKIPRGIAAARWLTARRRGEPLVPFGPFTGGLVVGAVAPWIAARAGGQATALAVVIGGFALLLDGALRRTTAPATLLTLWWRAAIGTSARSVVAWALADASAVVAFGAGAALVFGTALRTPLLGIAALPLILLAPVTLRTTALAVDTLFPADRHGPGAFMRLVVVGGSAAIIAIASFAAGACAGALASLVVATVLLLALLVLTAQMSARRLSAAT